MAKTIHFHMIELMEKEGHNIPEEIDKDAGSQCDDNESVDDNDDDLEDNEDD